MTPLAFLALALAGGIGATARFLLDGVIRAHSRGPMPWGTILINVSGSLVLGLLAGLAGGALLPDELFAITGAGFLGGYTTFSTASFETIGLLQERRWTLAAANGLGTLVVATGAAGLGLWVGSLF